MREDATPAGHPREMRSPATPGPGVPRLGLRANLGQFSVLVAVNALVGGMLGQERTVVPLLAGEEFGLGAFTAALTFILAFGVTKAVTNLFAGVLADHLGRKPVLVGGWVVGLPVPLMLIVAPSWDWVVVANVLLGVHQGLTWSTTVVMKIDLVGPHRRGLAMGWNEAAGYGAVALTALATGFIAQRYGLRPAPFALGIAYAGLGLACSALFVRETHHHVHLEAAGHVSRDGRLHDQLTTREVFALTTARERALSSCTQAGLVNNLNDALAWGLFPLHFAAAGLSVGRIGVLAALYPAVWGLGQIVTGGLSDRFGRKPLVAGGMLLQAGSIAWIAATSGFVPWAVGVTLLGAGTAMVYPTLLAAIGDVAHPRWRARAMGVYRFWRDAGFAVGALVAGVLADMWSAEAAIWAVAALTGASGLVVIVRMYETARATIEP
ncbi:MAG: MFS transporter [Acidimicrobiia bacterium]|nr:MAG: MFS transporter [Acidimicrobiia bacterium]